MSGPLRRRYDALASVDDDASEDWTPSERDRFVDASRQAAAQADRRNREHGMRLLADYLAPGIGYPEALRLYVDELLGRGS